MELVCPPLGTTNAAGQFLAGGRIVSSCRLCSGSRGQSPSCRGGSLSDRCYSQHCVCAAGCSHQKACESCRGGARGNRGCPYCWRSSSQYAAHSCGQHFPSIAVRVLSSCYPGSPADRGSPVCCGWNLLVDRLTQCVHRPG